jgi:uncharacterized integral membrane protein
MSTDRSDPAERSRVVSTKLVVAVVVAVLATVLVFQNTDEGRFEVLFWTIRMPAWIWFLAVFAGGVVVGSVFPWLRRRGRRG